MEFWEYVLDHCSSTLGVCVGVCGSIVWAAHCSMKLNMNFYCAYDANWEIRMWPQGRESNCSAGQEIKYYETYFYIYICRRLISQ